VGDGPRNVTAPRGRIDVAVGAKVQEALAVAGISLEEATSELDLSLEDLRACLEGRKRFAPQTLHKVSLMTGRPIIWFFGG
jgi:hypothetical protein